MPGLVVSNNYSMHLSSREVSMFVVYVSVMHTVHTGIFHHQGQDGLPGLPGANGFPGSTGRPGKPVCWYSAISSLFLNPVYARITSCVHTSCREHYFT